MHFFEQVALYDDRSSFFLHDNEILEELQKVFHFLPVTKTLVTHFLDRLEQKVKE